MKTDAHPIIDLWTLVKGAPSIDPDDLRLAVEEECRSDSLDYRTRMLVHESLVVLCDRWGKDPLLNLLTPEIRVRAEALLNFDPGEIRFPTLGRRVKKATDIQTIITFLRELGNESNTPAKLEVGGSTALILRDLLRRGTDDIDVVNEVPANLRDKQDLLNRLAERHGLMLAHFQSHYLPDGYQNRLHYLDRFNLLDVYLVDPLDIFVGKLFSRRDKDLDDLRMLHPNFPVEEITDRLKSSGASLLSDPQFRSNAERNWYILFGQSLPA